MRLKISGNKGAKQGEYTIVCYQCKGVVEKIRPLHRKSIKEGKRTAATNRGKGTTTTKRQTDRRRQKSDNDDEQQTHTIWRRSTMNGTTWDNI
jgi:hypothetical protein